MKRRVSDQQQLRLVSENAAYFSQLMSWFADFESAALQALEKTRQSIDQVLDIKEDHKAKTGAGVCAKIYIMQNESFFRECVRASFSNVHLNSNPDHDTFIVLEFSIV